MRRQTRKKTVEAPVMAMRAAFVPETASAEARTVDIVWTTGARVYRQPFFDEPYFEELDLDASAVRLDRLNNGAPLLNAHGSFDLRDVIGVVETATVDGKEGRATVRFSDREDVEPIFRDVINGILQNISVGYRVYRYEEVQQDDDKVRTLRAVDWEPLELSVVPIGADDGAGFRSEGGKTNPCTIIRAPGAQPNEETVMTDETSTVQNEDEQETQRGATDNGPAPVNVKEIERKAAQQERKRTADINDAVRISGLDAKLATDLVERGVTIDEARAEIFTKMAEKDEAQETRSQHDIRMGEDSVDKFRTGAEASILVRSGMQSDNDIGNEMRGYSLRELARESLHIHNVNTRGMSAMEMVGRAFTHGTGDFANVLSNVANKSTLKGYEEAEETFQQWTSIGTLTDFKIATRVDINTFPSLREVRPGAEYKYITTGDRSETVQLATYGELFSIDRQAIINDDMGVFTRVPQKMGRAAIRTVGDLVYAILTDNAAMADGIALFHANHKNLLTGGAPLTATIDAMRGAMATQTGPGGNAGALNIRLQNLIVPMALEGASRLAMESDKEVVAAKTSTLPNIVRGTFGVVSDARLDAASASVWYGAANPASNDTIEVSYLDGMQTPVLEQRTGWSVDGVEFKVRIDAAAKALDFRGLAKNPG